MKQGRSLTDLAAELERQKQTHRDYIAPQGKLEAMVDASQGGREILLTGINGGMGLTPYAHGQVASHLGIPKAYYDRMLTEAPGLAADSINTWFQKSKDEKRMVRTQDNQVRAFLSSKFRPLDNFDLAEAVLPTLIGRGVQVQSCELTETRMYIKGILPSLSDPLPAGMAYGMGHEMIRVSPKEGRLVAAIVISNSDIGAGSLRVEPSVFTTWCTNLAIITAASMKKYHVGRSHDETDNFEVFRDETREADDRAFWLKVRDVVEAAFEQSKWDDAVRQVKGAAEQPIKSDDLPTVVDVTVKRLALPESTGASILKHLSMGGDLSQWGLSSAITAAANAWGDYEQATELERAGGKVLALEPKDWKVISEATA
jgi:hypothetical protein